MKIQIVTTTTTTKPTARGSYQELEVVYKNLTFQGKVESKKIMSFGAGAPSFTTLSTAAGGSTWEITVVKNDKGYNDWTSAVHADGSAGITEGAVAASTSKASATPRSTYETPEERAQRQVLIVRQSSLSSAIATLSVGAKSHPKPPEVIAVAKEYEAFVFGIVDPGPTGFADLPDFGEAEIN
jgi:hypothetical protein